MENRAAPNTISSETEFPAISEPGPEPGPDPLPAAGGAQGSANKGIFDVSKWSSRVERAFGKEFVGRWSSVQEMLDYYKARPTEPQSTWRFWSDTEKILAARPKAWGLGEASISRVVGCPKDEVSQVFEDNPRLDEIVEDEMAILIREADEDWEERLPMPEPKYRRCCDIALFDRSKWPSHVERVFGKEFVGRWKCVEDMLTYGFRGAKKWPSKGWTDDKLEFTARLIAWGVGGYYLQGVLDGSIDDDDDLYSVYHRIMDNPRWRKIVDEERALIRIDEEACSRAEAKMEAKIKQEQDRERRAVEADERFWTKFERFLSSKQ